MACSFELDDSSMRVGLLSAESDTLVRDDLTTEVQTWLSSENLSNWTWSEAAPAAGGLSAFVNLHIPPCILLFGTVGNVLTLLIMLLQAHNRTISVCFYMLVLSVVDTLVLWLLLFTDWLFFNFLQASNSAALCKTFLFLDGALSDYGCWLVVAMTADRCIAVTRPLQVYRLCTVRRAQTVSLVLLALATLKNTPIIWTAVLEGADHQTCVYSTSSVFMRTFSFVDMALVSVLPFAGISIMNVVIIGKIRHSLKMKNKHHGILAVMDSVSGRTQCKNSIASVPTGATTGGKTTDSDVFEPGNSGEEAPLKRAALLSVSSNPSSSRRVASAMPSHTPSLFVPIASKARSDALARATSRQTQLTIMLVLLSLFFIVLTLPRKVQSVVWQYVSREQHASIYNSLHVIAEKLWYANSAVHFYIYCISGTQFRADLRRVLQRAPQKVRRLQRPRAARAERRSALPRGFTGVNRAHFRVANVEPHASAPTPSSSPRFSHTLPPAASSTAQSSPVVPLHPHLNDHLPLRPPTPPPSPPFSPVCPPAASFAADFSRRWASFRVRHTLVERTSSTSICLANLTSLTDQEQALFSYNVATQTDDPLLQYLTVV